MAIFFYPATLGFDVLGDGDEPVPLGAVGIVTEEYHRLFEGQSHGMRIAADDAGYPVLLPQPEASNETSKLMELNWRDAQLTITDGIVIRHRDELEESSETTLTQEQYSTLQAYRRALRSWPDTSGFPALKSRPPVPSFLNAQMT